RAPARDDARVAVASGWQLADEAGTGSAARSPRQDHQALRRPYCAPRRTGRTVHSLTNAGAMRYRLSVRAKSLCTNQARESDRLAAIEVDCRRLVSLQFKRGRDTPRIELAGHHARVAHNDAAPHARRAAY